MVSELRHLYNESFSPSAYAAFLDTLNQAYGSPVGFRVAETPVFIPRGLEQRLLAASESILGVLTRPDFKQLTAGAVPPDLSVPGEEGHPLFLSIDFAVCQDEQGELTPQLIELQGFPSLFGFQTLLDRSFRQHFAVPASVSPYFSGLDAEGFVALLGKTVLGQHAPENVILLEIEPQKQKTNVDFYATQHLLGVQPVCISEIIKEDRQLFYARKCPDGTVRKTPVHRIYNRVIFDELLRRPDLLAPGNPDRFLLTDDVAVEWAGHPNWFFRVSKYTMPLLESPFVPECRFLSSLDAYPADLENYVLKPLYSFAGAGVKFDVTPDDLAAIPAEERAYYLLQRKVTYVPVIPSTDGGWVKAEIRLLYLWPEADAQPTLAINLARLSRGVMIGVDFNKNKTWVGGTIGFCERDSAPK